MTTEKGISQFLYLTQRKLFIQYRKKKDYLQNPNASIPMKVKAIEVSKFGIETIGLQELVTFQI